MNENKEFKLEALVEPLCLWYEKEKRSMPWRDDATPYHVWLSEIMLQQTRIEAAKAYYDRFTKCLPDIPSLAAVSEEELLKLWEGLGYYNRARNLKKAASLLVERYDGRLPADYDLLLSLPGIGRYTAGAIASIAYGLAEPAVDGFVGCLAGAPNCHTVFAPFVLLHACYLCVLLIYQFHFYCTPHTLSASIGKLPKLRTFSCQSCRFFHGP